MSTSPVHSAIAQRTGPWVMLFIGVIIGMGFVAETIYGLEKNGRLTLVEPA